MSYVCSLSIQQQSFVPMEQISLDVFQQNIM